jgi:ABC-type dipeptide/oligopeptide/nickel transport system ATPase subunit
MVHSFEFRVPPTFSGGATQRMAVRCEGTPRKKDVPIS